MEGQKYLFFEDAWQRYDRAHCSNNFNHKTSLPQEVRQKSDISECKSKG